MGFEGGSAAKIVRVFRWGGLTGLLKQVYGRVVITRRIQAASTAIKNLVHSDMPARSKFEAIYRHRLWAKCSPTPLSSKSLSGHGSTEKSTRVLRKELERYLQINNIHVIFDAPCGDFAWMRLVCFPSSCGYVGGDIVESVVEELNKKFSYTASPLSHSPAFRKFISIDLTEDQFPEADLWLCKDCIQHLSHRDIILVLTNYANSQIPVAIITNHLDVSSNLDIHTGDFRPVDLTRPPFNLPRPSMFLRDRPIGGENRVLGIWTRKEICDALAHLANDSVPH
jgi:hypothetical protein